MLFRSNVTLTTTDSNVTFNDKVISDGDANRNLTIDTNGNTGTVVFGNGTTDTIGVTNSYDLGVIDITGNLDLNAAIGNGATAGATSIEVSGISNLGADVTTSGDQTYTGAVTLSANITLTTTSDGSVSFVNTTDSDATDRTLAITTDDTGDVSFTGAVGGTGGLNGLTIDTNQSLIHLKIGRAHV